VAMQVSGGIGGVETAKPAIAFAHVVEIARRDPMAAAWLEAPAGRGDERGPAARAFRQFLDAFGDLVDGDAELSRPRWAEQPGLLLELLRVALRGPALDPDRAMELAAGQADRVRARAESALSFMEVRLYRELVPRLRDVVRLGARLRLRVAHARAMLRTIALDVDRRLVRLDPAFPVEGALECRFDELVQAVGNSRADLAPVVQLRRASRKATVTAGLPPVFTGRRPAWPAPPDDPKTLSGLGVSDGSVVGRVRFVGPRGEGVSDLAPGDIAVVGAADPGHGPLFWIAGALLSEVGNAWSDGAVLARELGKPLVSGVSHPRAFLHPGERVRVDGSRGVIERLEE
jgi:rifampicin phosphotransferase